MNGVRLEGLMVHGAPFTSAGMVKFLRLPALADLKTLATGSDSTDDDVLAAISQLKKLTGLQFDSCLKMTGKGIGQLRDLTELTGLTMLRCPAVSAEAMEQLQTLTKLEVLHLHGLQLTDRHIAALARFKLKTLLTNEAGIDDAMAVQLAKIQTLDALDLTKSPITDAALPELKQLKGLTMLRLLGTKVTAAGVADLQRALPNCKIEWDAPK